MEDTSTVWPHWPENRSPGRLSFYMFVCLSNINLRRDKCWTPPSSSSSWETGEWCGRCSPQKGVPLPPQGGGRGWGVVGALKGQDGCLLHPIEFLSPKWSPPVLSQDRGGQCIVQRCDMTFTQCFCQIGWGGGEIKIQTGAGRVLCFLHPFYRMADSLFSLVDTVLVPLSCPRHLTRLVQRHASLWCDNPCWAALPPVDQHSYVAGWPEQHPPCPRPRVHSRSPSVQETGRKKGDKDSAVVLSFIF